MKLYYSPGACSLASHISLAEAGLAFQAIAAPTKTKLLPDGSDYRKVNPLGYVPLLELDDGRRLTEGPAIMSWIADQAPAKKLAPAPGTWERYELIGWLNYIATELHKGGYGPFFNPAANDEFKAATKEKLATRLAHVDQQLAKGPFLTGADFTVADAYLFVVTNWSKPVGIDLSPYPNLVAWRERVGARPAVQQAMREEGLIK